MPDGTDLVGYRAKRHSGVVDLSKLDHYDPAEYWEEVRTSNGRIILDPGAFYILVSREAVHIPPDCAAEMAPYLAMVGEFRVHYAGFFDPGFGYGPAGGEGLSGRLRHSALPGWWVARVSRMCPCPSRVHPSDHALAN